MSEQRSARGRVATWWPARRRPGLTWPDELADLARRLAERLRTWALADIGPGRLVPWLAIAFGAGIVLYFTADREPSLWAALALFVGTAAAAIAARRRPLAFPLALAIAAAAAGFTTATAKRVLIAHPVLQAAAWNVEVAGFVEIREERERSDRIVVKVHHIGGPKFAGRRTACG
jgi:competence protein ComEC